MAIALPYLSRFSNIQLGGEVACKNRHAVSVFLGLRSMDKEDWLALVGKT